MNKLLTNFNGGYPIELEDLRFRDESYRSAITNLVGSLATHAILTGCQISENQSTGLMTVSSGWVVIDGEIGYLPVRSGLDETLQYGIVSDNFVDSSVVKVLQSGGSVKPNEIRQFKIESWHPSMNVEAKLWDLKQMVSVLKDKLGVVSNELIETSIVDTPPPFTWDSSNNRWRTKMQHGLTAPFYKLRGVMFIIEDGTNYTNKSLPFLVQYEIDNSFVNFYEYSAQISNSQHRDALTNNSVKCIFKMLP